MGSIREGFGSDTGKFCHIPAGWRRDRRVTKRGAPAACDLILYLLLLKEKEDDSGTGCP
jgi:hypothetical protein